jgi:hypothetical protein
MATVTNTDLRQMLHSSPATAPLGVDHTGQLLQILADCDGHCQLCADACLAESGTMLEELRRCIRLNLSCADSCQMTGRMLSRSMASDPMLLRMTLDHCAVMCRTCAEECESHSQHMEHCRRCAEACRTAERACAEAIERL